MVDVRFKLTTNDPWFVDNAVCEGISPLGYWCKVNQSPAQTKPYSRVHVTHPYNRISTTSAFNMRTLRLTGGVLLSFNSGPNRLKHAHMRRIRRSISNERSALWMTPPRYKNRFVYLYLWSAASMTIGGTRGVLTTGATAVVSNAGV